VNEFKHVICTVFNSQITEDNRLYQYVNLTEIESEQNFNLTLKLISEFAITISNEV
jgi:hypothetical protein